MAKKAKRYDCGSAGMLTMREIAGLARVSVCTVQRRVAIGITGDRLVLHRLPTYHRKRGPDWKTAAELTPPQGCT
jgi:hypothetical protein